MAFIQFYYGKRITFGPIDENVPGLGGSEGSLLVLARELAKRGHRVRCIMLVGHLVSTMVFYGRVLGI